MRRVLIIGFVAAMSLFVTMQAVSAAPADGSPSKVVQVKAAGVALSYPSDWTAVPVTKKRLLASLQRMGEKNPKAAAAVRDGLAHGDLALIKFFATSVETPVASKVTVARFPFDMRGSSAADLRDSVAPGVEGVGGTITDLTSTKVNGQKAFRYDVKVPVKRPDGTSYVSSSGTLLILRGNSSTLVSVASSNDEAGDATIDEVLGSVHRL